MDARDEETPPILMILRAVVRDPQAFASFLRNLTPTHLDAAWALALELAAIDDVAVSTNADLLAAWCTQQMLAGIDARARVGK